MQRVIPGLATAVAVLSLALAPAPALAEDGREARAEPERLDWPLDLDRPRLRFGAEAGFGMAWDTESRPAGALASGMRLGLQIDRWTAIYYQGRFTAAGAEVEPRRTVWLATTSNGVGMDVTIVSVVQLGAALSLDWLAGDACGGQLCAGLAEGLYAGVDVRVAAIPFGRESHPSGGRSGFVLVADWHVTPIPEDAVRGLRAVHSLTIGAGWEMY